MTMINNSKEVWNLWREKQAMVVTFFSWSLRRRKLLIGSCLCKSPLAVQEWDSQCSFEEFAPEKFYLLLGSNSWTQALSTGMLLQHLKFLKLLRSLPWFTRELKTFMLQMILLEPMLLFLCSILFHNLNSRGMILDNLLGGNLNIKCFEPFDITVEKWNIGWVIVQTIRDHDCQKKKKKTMQ